MVAHIRPGGKYFSCGLSVSVWKFSCSSFTSGRALGNNLFHRYTINSCCGIANSGDSRGLRHVVRAAAVTDLGHRIILVER